VEDAVTLAEAELGDDQLARISLRLPEQLKTRIEQAAAREGVSANTWIVRALSHGVSTGRAAQSHKRLTGYGWA
jgi:predicted DNA binding CopG/RHH family protein